MTTKYKLQFVGLCIFVIFIGAFIRIFAIINQPVWLDEQYTIVFANTFSIKDLLFHFRDTNHGIYYLLVKLLLNITYSITLLRLFFGIVPYVITSTAAFYFLRNNRFLALSVTILIALNPFLIHYSWQLRMYNIAIMVATLAYMLLRKCLDSNNKNLFFILIILLLIGNSIAYNMYFFSFFVILYVLMSKQITFKKSLLFMSLTTIVLILQFSLLGVLNPKTEFMKFSWIDPPTLLSIPSVISFTLGVGFQEYGQSTYGYASIFYALLFLFIIWIAKEVKLGRSRREILNLVILPYITLTTLSVILPFLAHRFFFHKFVPDVSFFLPRAFIPFSAILMFQIAELIKLNRIFAFIILCIVVIVWPFVHWHINTNSIHANDEKAVKELQYSQKEFNSLNLWPEWYYYRLITDGNFNRTQSIHRDVLRSELFFYCLTPEALTDNRCNDLNQENVVLVRKDNVQRMNQSHQYLTKILNKTCTKQSLEKYLNHIHEYDIWLCIRIFKI